MLKIECNEKRTRFETEPLEDGRTLVRLYEDEEAASRPAVSDMDTPWNGYRYTTYETRIALRKAVYGCKCRRINDRRSGSCQLDLVQDVF